MATQKHVRKSSAVSTTVLKRQLKAAEKQVKTLEDIFLPLDHASGPRMGREVLKRLKVARKNAGNNEELVAQVDSIIKAMTLGDRLVRDGSLLCW